MAAFVEYQYKPTYDASGSYPKRKPALTAAVKATARSKLVLPTDPDASSTNVISEIQGMDVVAASTRILPPGRSMAIRAIANKQKVDLGDVVRTLDAICLAVGVCGC